jgi:hypothetical protein
VSRAEHWNAHDGGTSVVLICFSLALFAQDMRPFISNICPRTDGGNIFFTYLSSNHLAGKSLVSSDRGDQHSIHRCVCVWQHNIFVFDM